MAGFAFYSGALLQTAYRAAAKGATDPDQCLVAVVFAAAGLEAFVNECVDYLQEPQLNNDKGLDQVRAIVAAGDLTARNASLTTKIQLLSAGLRGRTFDRGSQPFQDYDLLVALRNALLHQRMERLSGDDTPDVKPNRIVDRIKTRGVLDIPPGAAYSVFGLASSPAVAQWAVEASTAMVNAVSSLFPAYVQRILSFNTREPGRSP